MKTEMIVALEPNGRGVLVPASPKCENGKVVNVRTSAATSSSSAIMPVQRMFWSVVDPSHILVYLYWRARPSQHVDVLSRSWVEFDGKQQERPAGRKSQTRGPYQHGQIRLILIHPKKKKLR